MRVDIENKLRLAIQAIKAGDKTTGQELLTQGEQRNDQAVDSSHFFLSTLM